MLVFLWCCRFFLFFADVVFRARDSHAECCSVLQCVAVCCSVLQCAAAFCGMLQCVAVWFSVLQ